MKKFTLHALAALTSYALLSLDATPQKIMVYAIYTPSHAPLFQKWFEPSIQEFNEFTVAAESHQQECPSGGFMEPGWTATMIRKIDLVIKAIESHMAHPQEYGEFFIHADVDIQFLDYCADSIRVEIEDHDMAFQRENPAGGLCGGFFVCRANEKTHRLFEHVRAMISETRNDQMCLNDLLRFSNPFDIRWKYLPDSFFGGATLKPGGWVPAWTPESGEIPLPLHPKMHHANFTVGLENKEKQLMQVKMRVQAMKNHKKSS